MSLSIDELANEALQLPVELRALLADRLVESLDLTEPNEIQKLWTVEAIQRRDAIRSGAVRSVPGDQTLAEARRLVGR
ncbi:MAG TPA: addiction module protein [Phycisphaerae bacterium]|nr:addiction module protein [Phycisphaerae bacterium]